MSDARLDRPEAETMVDTGESTETADGNFIESGIVDGGAVDSIDSIDTVDGPNRSEVVHGPEDLNGLVLWLDSAEGVSVDNAGRVKTWLDRSREKHVAAATVTGPMLMRNPLDDFPALEFGIVDGHTVTLTVADDVSLRWGTGGFAVAAVVRYWNEPASYVTPSGIGSILAKQQTPFPHVGPVLFVNDPWPEFLRSEPATSGVAFSIVHDGNYRVSSITTGYNDRRIHIVIAQRQGPVLRLRVDGSPVGSTISSTLVDVSSPDVPLTIGANPVSLIQQLTGQLFELIAIRGELSDDQRSGLERYLIQKYHTPAPS